MKNEKLFMFAKLIATNYMRNDGDIEYTLACMLDTLLYGISYDEYIIIREFFISHAINTNWYDHDEEMTNNDIEELTKIMQGTFDFDDGAISLIFHGDYGKNFYGIRKYEFYVELKNDKVVDVEYMKFCNQVADDIETKKSVKL